MSLFDFFKPKSKKKKSAGGKRGEPRFIGNNNYGYDDEDDRRRNAPKKPKARRVTLAGQFRRWLWGFCFRISFVVVFLLGGYTAYIYLTLPDISKLTEFKKTPSIIVKAENGTVIGTYGDVYGDYVPYFELPKFLIDAIIATEDRNFFHHHGIDPMGVLRAMYVNIKAHHLVQGGSTITQQVAKNVFLTPERTLKRKLQEVLLALELERRYSKQEILTIYLNRVYMGAGNYGVDSAARRYFGHPVRNITLGEAAILVGLLKAPTRYAPTNNPDLSEKRATQVLLNMEDAGYLTEKQVDAAEAEFGDEDSNYRDGHTFGAYYFSDYVVSILSQYIGDTREDIVVTTTLNVDAQRMAEDAVNAVMNAKGKTLKASQAAIVSMTPDGAIRAMVGGRNYRSSQFNRVTQALRQPGSSFKLFVYLAALEAGFTPDSEMIDQPINVGNWHPRDYTGKYQGRMMLRDAFAQSINSIAVQLSETVGRDKVIEMARRLGITSDMNPDPSIALGTNEVTLLDMTKAYAHLAANGSSVLPYAITRVENSVGFKLYERPPVVTGEVLQGQTVRMMNNMLLAVTTLGTGRGAQIGRPVAGKTGTTSDYRDAWFIGFTPQLVTGVWVGNDDTAPMKKVSGASLPASIWRQYMAEAMKGIPVAEIPNQNNAGILQGLLPWFYPQQTPAPGNAAQPPRQPQPGQPPLPVPFNANSTPVPPPPANNSRIPEEEPTPRYDAPSSFWDKLLGN